MYNFYKSLLKESLFEQVTNERCSIIQHLTNLKSNLAHEEIRIVVDTQFDMI